jgi:hypothetical protein
MTEVDWFKWSKLHETTLPNVAEHGRPVFFFLSVRLGWNPEKPTMRPTIFNYHQL